MDFYNVVRIQPRRTIFFNFLRTQPCRMDYFNVLWIGFVELIFSTLYESTVYDAMVYETKLRDRSTSQWPRRTDFSLLQESTVYKAMVYEATVYEAVFECFVERCQRSIRYYFITSSAALFEDLKKFDVRPYIFAVYLTAVSIVLQITVCLFEASVVMQTKYHFNSCYIWRFGTSYVRPLVFAVFWFSWVATKYYLNRCYI